MPDFFELLRSDKEEKFLDKIEMVDVHRTDELGRSLLHVAIANGRNKAVTALIAKGANVNLLDEQHGYSPLHVAAEYGAADVVELLLRSGADPNILDKHGNSPLWTAVFQSRASAHGIDIVKKMVDAGGKPSHKNKAGRSPLDMARQFENDNLITVLSQAKRRKT